MTAPSKVQPRKSMWPPPQEGFSTHMSRTWMAVLLETSPLTEFTTLLLPPFGTGGGGEEDLEVTAQATMVMSRARAVVIPAAQDAASHPSREVGPPPNHNLAASAATIATAAATAPTHLALVISPIVALNALRGKGFGGNGRMRPAGLCGVTALDRMGSGGCGALQPGPQGHGTAKCSARWVPTCTGPCTAEHTWRMSGPDPGLAPRLFGSRTPSELGFCGALGRIRTCDHRVRSPVVCQTS